jgi:hypothetical protein
MTRVNGGIQTGSFGFTTLAMFTIVVQDAANANVDLSGDVGAPNTALEAIVNLIGTKATTVMIGAVAAGGFRVAVEPNAWTASDLQAAIRALGTVNGDNLTGSDVTAFTF